jgi:hypothetical protein
MSWTLLLGCLAALGCMQAGCWALARGLGVALERRAMALGLALPVVLLAPWLFGGELLAPTGTLDRVLPGLHASRGHLTHLLLSDTTYQFIPWELEVRHALRERRLPLWSDRLDGGSSPWSNPQAAALSPIAMLTRLAPIQHFLLLALALKVLVAAEGAWLLARRLGCSRVAALLAAASFSLGGGVMSWALFPHSAAAAWVPWLTLGAIVCCRRPAPRAIATTALIGAALLLAGHPETALAGGLFAAVCGLGLRRRRIGLRRGLAAAGLAALLGFGLAAPQVVPFLRAVPGSQRTRDMLALPVPAQDVHLLRPASWFLPAFAAYLRAPVSPRAYGEPYGARFEGPFDWADALSGYAGLAALAGAVVAGVALRRRRVWPFLGFAVAALLLVSGFTPFTRVIYAVPALRVPAWPRLLPVACLGIAIAAACGWDLVVYGRGGGRRRGRTERRGPVVEATPAPLPAAAPATARVTAPGPAPATARTVPPAPARRAGLRPALASLAALAVAAAISLAVDRSPSVVLVWALLAAAPLAARWRAGAGALALAAALALDLGPWAQRLLPHGEPGLFYPGNPLTATLAREAGADGFSWRCVGMDRLVYPSLLPVYGLAELRPDNVLAPSDQLEVLRLAFGFAPSASNYYAAFGRVEHPLLSFLNVRAVVGNVYLPRPRTRTLVPVAEPRSLPFVVYRNERALPRWFVPAAVDVIDPAGLPAWIAGLEDPGRVAVYRRQLRGWAPPPPVAGVARGARLLAARPGHVELEVPGEGHRLLATSLPSPEGWHARAAGGRELAKVTVDGAFLGVLCPGGVTRVSLDFRPPGLGAGLGICALAVVVLAALLWQAARNRRRR